MRLAAAGEGVDGIPAGMFVAQRRPGLAWIVQQGMQQRGMHVLLFGRDAQRLAQGCHGFRNAARFPLNDAQLGQRRRVAGAQLRHCLPMLVFIVISSGLAVDAGQKLVRLGRCGIQRNGPP